MRRSSSERCMHRAWQSASISRNICRGLRAPQRSVIRSIPGLLAPQPPPLRAERSQARLRSPSCALCVWQARRRCSDATSSLLYQRFEIYRRECHAQRRAERTCRKTPSAFPSKVEREKRARGSVRYKPKWYKSCEGGPGRRAERPRRKYQLFAIAEQRRQTIRFVTSQS